MHTIDELTPLLARYTDDERCLLDGWIQARCKWHFMCCELSATEASRVADMVALLGQSGITLTPPRPRPAPSDRAIAERERRKRQQEA